MFPLDLSGSSRFGKIESPQTHEKFSYDHCSLKSSVFQTVLIWLMVEPHQTHEKTFLRSLFPQQHGSSSMFSNMLLQQLNSDLFRCAVWAHHRNGAHKAVAELPQQLDIAADAKQVRTCCKVSILFSYFPFYVTQLIYKLLPLHALGLLVLVFILFIKVIAGMKVMKVMRRTPKNLCLFAGFNCFLSIFPYSFQ